jgi:hypothetical protein
MVKNPSQLLLKLQRKNDMEEDLIIEVWDVFKEYVPEKNRETAASHYVDFLLGKDVETSTLEGLIGYDSALDSAIELVLGETEEDNVDDDWGDEEEEY